MCVTSDVARTDTRSRRCGGTPSKTRSPAPTMLAVTCRRSSSRSPAARNWLTVPAPPATEMFRLAGLGPRPLERGLDPVGHEVEGRAALHLDRVVRVMGEHEDGVVVRRIRPPPAAPVAIPLAADRAEHVAAHDGRPGVDDRVDFRLVLVGGVEHPGVRASSGRSSPNGSSSRWLRPAAKPSAETAMSLKTMPIVES